MGIFVEQGQLPVTHLYTPRAHMRQENDVSTRLQSRVDLGLIFKDIQPCRSNLPIIQRFDQRFFVDHCAACCIDDYYTRLHLGELVRGNNMSSGSLSRVSLPESVTGNMNSETESCLHSRSAAN
jgi:hypothetical protein